MYEIFGNFDNYEEINACAAGLKAEGDTENLKKLAKENGIQEDFVELYMDGMTEELTDWMNAAMGKLDVEGAEYKNNQIPVEPILDYLRSLCTEEQFARSVRRRTKTIKECMKGIEEKCKKIQQDTGKHYVADLTVFHWARDYFLEGQQ